MTLDLSKELSSLLLDARADPVHCLPRLSVALQPRSEAQAYLVQQAVNARLGPIGGWKVGSPKPNASCTCAPMPLSGFAASPAQLPSVEAGARAVEAEIAFCLGADLPPRDGLYSREEVIAAVASCHPAIEIVQSRYVDPEAQDPWSLLADNLSHGGFVFGQPAPGWQAIDFGVEDVVLAIDGVEAKRCVGNPAGDMIRLVQWLADTGARWAGGLRAGQFITCGSWTGKDKVQAGEAVSVAFARVGGVALEFGR